jgi:hypothetical protein
LRTIEPIRALAVSTLERAAILPDVPTMTESGYPGFEVSAWLGLMAAQGTPDAIIQRITDTAAAAVHTPEISARLDPRAAPSWRRLLGCGQSRPLGFGWPASLCPMSSFRDAPRA